MNAPQTRPQLQKVMLLSQQAKLLGEVTCWGIVIDRPKNRGVL